MYDYLLAISHNLSIFHSFLAGRNLYPLQYTLTLRRSSRISRKERIRNVTIRQQTGLEETIVKEIEQNQLTWYGHVQRMTEGRLPKIALKWMPKQKRARGRPKKNWMERIRKATNERNLSEGQWEDRKQWSLDVGQRRKTF
jgi:hypothetical protein